MKWDILLGVGGDASDGVCVCVCVCVCVFTCILSEFLGARTWALCSFSIHRTELSVWWVIKQMSMD